MTIRSLELCPGSGRASAGGWIVLAAGQAQPWLDLLTGSYAPTWVEIVGVVGMAALGIVLYLVALRLGPKEV